MTFVGDVDEQGEPRLLPLSAMMAAPGDRTTETLAGHDPGRASANRNSKQPRRSVGLEQDARGGLERAAEGDKPACLCEVDPRVVGH